MKLRLVLLLALFAAALSFAKDVPLRPKNSYVYDENRTLTAQETEMFNRISEELYRKAGVAMALAIFKNVEGEEPRDFALRVATEWGIGGRYDEGVLIFVAMDEKWRSVEVGYGAEEILPDALIEHIQQKTVVREFRLGKYGSGIVNLAVEIATSVASAKNVSLGGGEGAGPADEVKNVGIIPTIIVVFILIALLSTQGGRSFLYFMFLSMLYRGNSGSGGRSGESFGSGFGGGRFGGGGSGGSW